MKVDQLMNAIGSVDPEYITEAYEEGKNRRRRRTVLVHSVRNLAAVVAVFCLVGTAIHGISSISGGSKESSGFEQTNQAGISDGKDKASPLYSLLDMDSLELCLDGEIIVLERVDQPFEEWADGVENRVTAEGMKDKIIGYFDLENNRLIPAAEDAGLTLYKTVIEDETVYIVQVEQNFAFFKKMKKDL